jgi:hypothetical protein
VAYSGLGRGWEQAGLSEVDAYPVFSKKLVAKLGGRNISSGEGYLGNTAPMATSAY